jgi:hypothetical protein
MSRPNPYWNTIQIPCKNKNISTAQKGLFLPKGRWGNCVHMHVILSAAKDLKTGMTAIYNNNNKRAFWLAFKMIKRAGGDGTPP